MRVGDPRLLAQASRSAMKTALLRCSSAAWRETHGGSLCCIWRRTALVSFTGGSGSRGLTAAAAGEQAAGSECEQAEAGGLGHAGGGRVIFRECGDEM